MKLGRIDNQIKIMGRRFQLEEVEEHIYTKVPSVEFCKVLCNFSDEKQRKVLQAFLVTEALVEGNSNFCHPN